MIRIVIIDALNHDKEKEKIEVFVNTGHSQFISGIK